MLPAALRIFILSVFARWGLQVIWVMNFPIGKLSKFLIRCSRARVIALSRDAWLHYREAIGDQAVYLKTGVDTQRFCPVDDSRKAALRKAYGVPPGKRVALHVGHLNVGRNVGQLLKLDKNWHGILAVSTLTVGEQDEALRTQLAEKENITLIDWFLPNIEELYQLADVYLFPVVQSGRCIDVPLSALEAAACGIPVVTTSYGEMKELIESPGFYPIESFEPAALNALLETAAAEGCSPRQSVLEYDWNITVKQLLL